MHVRPDRVQLPQHPVVERRSIDVSERAILRSACEAMTGQPFAAVVALVLAGAGCMVGPNYRRPDVVTPPSWGELAPTAPPAGRSDTVADGSPTAWWTTFDDALLTSLIQRTVEAGGIEPPSETEKPGALSDPESPSDLERFWNAFGHALAAEVSHERGAELFDRDPGRADQLAQRPRRQLAMVGDRDRGDGARLHEDHVVAGLAAED